MIIVYFNLSSSFFSFLASDEEDIPGCRTLELRLTLTEL